MREPLRDGPGCCWANELEAESRRQKAENKMQTVNVCFIRALTDVRVLFLRDTDNRV